MERRERRSGGRGGGNVGGDVGGGVNRIRKHFGQSSSLAFNAALVACAKVRKGPGGFGIDVSLTSSGRHIVFDAAIVFRLSTSTRDGQWWRAKLYPPILHAHFRDFLHPKPQGLAVVGNSCCECICVETSLKPLSSSENKIVACWNYAAMCATMM